MIDRYARPQMKALWEPARRYATWLKVELLACEALTRLGVIPAQAYERIQQRAVVDSARADEIEQRVKHDVVAFLAVVAERVGPEARYLHYGLTSSDVLDTSLAVLMVEAADLLREGLDRLMEAVKALAGKHRETVMIGRTHGMHGEPITFGFKMALWYEELKRHRERLRQAREEVRCGKVSGAMGTFAHLAPEVEASVCQALNLKPDPASSQVIQRDRHAAYLTTLALLAASLEKFATELRHLQRTEVGEVEEPFSEGQAGSSAMPHKRNPVECERIAGLARVVRANAQAALENVVLWHERDISHSSAERIIIPDSTTLVDFMLDRLTAVLEGLTVNPDRMRENLEMTQGLIYSERVLLELIRRGLTRQAAYTIVQRHAHHAMQATGEKASGASFRDLLAADPEVTRLLDKKTLDACFSPAAFLRHLDEVYRRVFS